MSFSVTLQPSGVQFTVAESQTVLAGAHAAGTGLPYSCMKGICRTCRGHVVAGETRQIFSTLPEDEVAAGYRLLCQTVPLSDLVVESKIVPLPAKTDINKALITEIREVAPDVKVLTLRLPPRHALKYEGGQYLEIIFPDEERRSYSLATAPGAQGNWEFELHIRHTPGGRFTDHVFGSMQPREAVTICGPMGTFFLRKEGDKPIILLATGTGYAPIRALLLQALAEGCTRDIRLYWGGRTAADLYMAEEAADLAGEHTNLTFIPVLSQPLPTDGWQGRTGYITDAAAQDIADMSQVQVYACGSSAMVDSAQEMFTREHGLPDDEFFADAFLDQSDYAKRIQTA